MSSSSTVATRSQAARPASLGAAREPLWVRLGLGRVVSALGLLALSPLFVIIAIAIVVEDGFPVLFRQRRVGKGGRPFDILKFRSMRVTQGGPLITGAGDRRITGVGAILRKLKLDELPQLWNVAAGDMELIGPRPEVPKYVDQADPRWRAVLSVKPGITDLATLVYRDEEQVLAGSADIDRDYRTLVLPNKLDYNLAYIERRNTWTDLRLIVQTAHYSLRPGKFDAAMVERQVFGEEYRR